MRFIFFGWEHECDWGAGGGVSRCRAWSHDPEITIWAETKSWIFNWLCHPDTPTLKELLKIYMVSQFRSVFDKIWNPIHDKINSKQKGTSLLWQPLIRTSLQISYAWWNTESFSLKFENETKTSTNITFLEHSNRSPGQWSKARKRNKRYKVGKNEIKWMSSERIGVSM